ncbi:MAG: M23 family metallopeptidase [Alphaproteobacteria bacterium]|nr:M23 family metallopeptidase [Alphaproteobacteria bacterium]MCB9791438.1 M23 family metallopeptidase [Alphaproteobacteria bacterium]
MKRKAPAPPARGGLIDLLLVVVVVLGVWTRTPMGALGTWAYALASGDAEAERPSLIATFVTAPIPEVIARIEAVAGPLLVDSGEGPFPEPFRTAAKLSLGEAVPEASKALLAQVAAEEPGPLDVLDLLHAGDPEATLEIYAIGEELRARAIQRARSAGEPDPTAYAVHRRYLPAAAARQADTVVTGTLGVAAVLGLAWPIAGDARISSPYGYRFHPVLKKQKLHNGVDIAVPIGTPVLAAQEGTVSVAKEDNLNGRYVVIDHGYGVRSSYCHLDELGVEAGDEIERAAEIGKSGNTGRSTGPHLHFTLRVGGKTVDPEKFRAKELEQS